MDKIKFLMTDTGAQTTQLCRQALEAKTNRPVVSADNYLPLGKALRPKVIKKDGKK